MFSVQQIRNEKKQTDKLVPSTRSEKLCASPTYGLLVDSVGVAPDHPPVVHDVRVRRGLLGSVKGQTLHDRCSLWSRLIFNKT